MSDSDENKSESEEPAADSGIEQEKQTSAHWRNWSDHPYVVASMLSVSVIATIAAVLSLRSGPASAPEIPVAELEPCVDVVGRWDWLTTGGIVTVAEGGALTFHVNDLTPVSAFRGSWTCSENNGEIQMAWETGMSDSLFLSEDGRRISGVNNQNGVTISGTRRN